LDLLLNLTAEMKKMFLLRRPLRVDLPFIRVVLFVENQAFDDAATSKFRV